MHPVVEDSILFIQHPHEEAARAKLRESLGVCPTCGRGGLSDMQAAKQIGISRFVLRRFLDGKGQPRLRNYLRILRWLTREVK